MRATIGHLLEVGLKMHESQIPESIYVEWLDYKIKLYQNQFAVETYPDLDGVTIEYMEADEPNPCNFCELESSQIAAFDRAIEVSH